MQFMSVNGQRFRLTSSAPSGGGKSVDETERVVQLGYSVLGKYDRLVL
jgi:hypothetical protein